MRAVIAIAAGALLLAGCTEAENRATASARALAQTTYGRDGRTDLCFSTTFININGNYQFSHANVPCTAEVLTQIRKPVP